MASATALPEDAGDAPAGGTKRRRADDDTHGGPAGDAESKRRRTSSGKNSPTTAPADTAAAERRPAPTPADSESPASTAQNAPAPTADDSRESRRKSEVAEEKQRSKRLFGALLGHLNPAGDRAARRRGEIEHRKKAELQKQDDERLEYRQRRLGQLAIQRAREQIRVDEDGMRVRHRQALHVAHFLHTRAEPQLYYRPWELLPDEEDRIDGQVRAARAHVDRERGEWAAEKSRRLEAAHPALAQAGACSSNGAAAADAEAHEPPHKPEPNGPEAAPAEAKEASDADDQAPPKGTDEAGPNDAPDTAAAPESSTTLDAAHQPAGAGASRDTNGSGPKAADESPDDARDDADDEDHFVEGDEDNVIY